MEKNIFSASLLQKARDWIPAVGNPTAVCHLPYLLAWVLNIPSTKGSTLVSRSFTVLPIPTTLMMSARLMLIKPFSLLTLTVHRVRHFYYPTGLTKQANQLA